MEPVIDYAGVSDNKPQGAVVLLVDDQAEVGEAVRSMLADKADIDFHFCPDAQDALNIATQTRPTVILQDLVLPCVDGLSLVRAYRANPATRDIPIVVLSSKEDTAGRNAAFSAGANDYLLKLPDSIELIARIRYHSRAYAAMRERDETLQVLRIHQRQLMETQLALRRLTHSDGLTGLANRRYFDSYLSTEWQRAIRDCTAISLLILDVDHFKSYNETYGHMAGDEVLKKVAQTIAGCCDRSTDTPARFGGEEFTVVLSGISPAEARLTAEKIRRSIEGLHIPHRDSTTSRWLTVSAGIATLIPARQDRYTQIIAAADRGLSNAKRRGRNRVVAHTDY